jgi:hypothetical protein
MLPKLATCIIKAAKTTIIKAYNKANREAKSLTA